MYYCGAKFNIGKSFFYAVTTFLMCVTDLHSLLVVMHPINRQEHTQFSFVASKFSQHLDIAADRTHRVSSSHASLVGRNNKYNGETYKIKGNAYKCYNNTAVQQHSTAQQQPQRGNGQCKGKRMQMLPGILQQLNSTVQRY